MGALTAENSFQGSVTSIDDIPLLSAEEMERLSSQYAATRDRKSREMLILQHQRLVRSIAVRFLGSGEALDDLIQVGNIGLINALDRFDPSQGNRFSTYATPTILGEIKRYFRDKTPGIKIPRWLQEINQTARRISLELTHQLGRPPVPAEIADRMRIPEEHLLLALESGEALNLLSLDSYADAGSAEAPPLQELVGRRDRTMGEFEAFGDLRTALSRLNAREREVISLRFFDEMSQAKIAQKLNISQMHVSRLQQRALRHLREMLSDEICPRPAYRRNTD